MIRKFCGTKVFYGSGGGGGGVCDGLLRFYVEKFYLTVPKNFVVEFFCVSKKFLVSTTFVPKR